METRLGGRWYELAEDGTETNVGKVIAWESPKRFVSGSRTRLGSASALLRGAEIV
jgi:hypothetical protein